MSAHIRPLTLRCDRSRCTKRALVEVFNSYNSGQGRYCRAHGAERLKELRADEQGRERKDEQHGDN